jgi:hypothetical protein
MHPTDEFLRHAAEGEQMAKFTRGTASVPTWNRMAERWRRYAEIQARTQRCATLCRRGKASAILV